MIAFREIGKGHSAIETVFGYMNCVPPMLVVAFNKIQKDVGAADKTVATDSMLKAATERKRTSTDVAVSCDGSWQK